MERVAVRHELESLASERPIVVLGTCHRVDAYLPGRLLGDRAVAQTLERLPSGVRRLEDGEAARHIAATAVGLESTVVGEDQILHQLRDAVSSARRRGRLPDPLDRILDVALVAGRRARSWDGHRPRSLAEPAVERILASRPSGGIPFLVVVGSGRMAALAAGAADRRGAAIVVAARDPERGAAVASRFGARAVPLDPGPEVLREAAGAVVALSGPWLPSAESARALEASDAPVVDLSMPQAVSEPIRERLGARYVSIDDLARPDAPAGDDDRLRRRLEALVDDATAGYREWLERRPASDAARRIAEAAERERLAQLDRLWRRLPELAEDERAVIEAMSRQLTRRLLREPLRRIARDRAGERHEAARDLFGL